MSPEKPHGEQAGKAKATATLGEKARVYPKKNEIKDNHVKQLANTRGGTRTHNLLLRREAPYPLGHTSCVFDVSGRHHEREGPSDRKISLCARTRSDRWEASQACERERNKVSPRSDDAADDARSASIMQRGCKSERYQD